MIIWVSFRVTRSRVTRHLVTTAGMALDQFSLGAILWERKVTTEANLFSSAWLIPPVIVLFSCY